MAALNKEYKDAYQDIMGFYRYAERLVDTVDDPATDNPEEQLEVVEPLIEEIEGSTEVIANEFRQFIKEGQPLGVLSQKRIETALRNIYLSMCDTQLRAANLPYKKAKRDLDMTYEHLSRHLEKVFSGLSKATHVALKSYLFSRRGRQEGNSLSKKKHDEQN